MKTALLMALTASLVLSASCGKKESFAGTQISNAASEAGTIIEKQGANGDWKIVEKMTRDGDVYFKQESLPSEKVDENVRKEYKDTKMKQVPVDPRFNAQLFRIDGNETRNAVFIAPKIYAYSGNEANKAEPLINDDDGTMTLFFPIVFVDGLSETIEAPNQLNGMIRLPPNLLVQDKAGLIQSMNKLYHEFGEQNIAQLPGCPKQIIMTVAGREFDIAADVLKRADYCQYNKPIYTSVKLPKAEALWLLQKGLYSGAAKMSAIFETRVPYAVAKMTIEMNKGKLYEEIAARMQIKYKWANVDIQTEIQKIVKRQAMKITIQGDMSAPLSGIVEQSIAEFFEKMPVDPAKADMSCGAEPFCLKFKYTKQSFEETFSVSWDQTSNVLSGQNILTWTGLSSLADDVFAFDNLQNSGGKKEALMTVYDGALLEMKINKIENEKLVQDYKTNRAHNNVLVRTDVEMDCSNQTFVPGKVVVMGPPPSRGFPCRKTSTPVYEDHWVDTTVASVLHQSEIINNPVGQVDEITDNLALEFRWNSGGATVSKICPINLFEREGDARTLLLTISNVPGCEVFEKNSSNKPLIYLINKAEVKSGEFKEGTSTKNWKGETTSNLKDYIYPIKSSYTGTIVRRGAVITTNKNTAPVVKTL